MRFTFEKRLGHTNPLEISPVVKAGGEAWVTKGGRIVLIPDQWESEPPEVGEFKPLPEEVTDTARIGE